MVMRALSRKLLRDFWHTRSQGLAISLVIAAGVAMFVALLQHVRLAPARAAAPTTIASASPTCSSRSSARRLASPTTWPRYRASRR